MSSVCYRRQKRTLWLYLSAVLGHIHRYVILFDVISLICFVTSFPTSRSLSRNDAVKVDFDNMRIEKSYHRADLRRLSTESYVKQEGKSLSTQWLWYRKEESGDWIKYGVTVRWSKWKMEGICGITTELWKKFRFAQDQTLMRCTIPNICQGKKNHQKSNFFSFSIVRNNYHAKSPAKKLRASMTTIDNFSFHTLSNCTFLLYDVASIIAPTL